jgi:hypothetical protein
MWVTVATLVVCSALRSRLCGYWPPAQESDACMRDTPDPAQRDAATPGR